MPTYEYRCKQCGEHLEVVQSFKDEALKVCPACSGPLRKVFGSIGIAFKGSGFYKNDSRPATKSDSGSTEKTSSETKSSDSASGSKSSAKPAETSSSGSKASGSKEAGSKGAGSKEAGSKAAAS